jgi:class 3 adenylate cyclase
MTTQEVKRKLTAILSADIKGYRRLMGEDEMATLIRQHRGRVVGNAGDTLLAELQNGILDPAYSSPTMVFTRRPIF